MGSVDPCLSPTMTTKTSARVILNISDNQGYAPDQIATKMTLARLLEAVEEAIEDFGPDAQIVLNNGQRYGASYGYIVDSGSAELFESEGDSEDGEDW